MSNFDFLGSFLGKRTNFAKDGHDMSNIECSSHPFAEIVPLKMYHCVPNEHYKVNVKGYVQTDSMREDNFAEIYQNMKAVFVPMSTIWRDYLGATQNSRDTRYDEMYSSIMGKSIPIFNIVSYLKYLFRIEFLIRCASAWQDATPYWRDIYLKVEASKLSLCYHSGHVLYSNVDAQEVGLSSGDPVWDSENGDSLGIYQNNRAALAFCNILATCVQYTFTGRIDIVYVMNELENFRSLGNTSFVIDSFRLLDNLGYGNYLPIFDRWFNQLLSEVGDFSYEEWASSIETFYYILDIANASACVWKIGSIDYDISDVFEDLGFNDFSDSDVSLLPLIAYQYYINTCEVSNYRLPIRGLISYDSILENLSGLSSCFENRTTEIALKVPGSGITSQDFVSAVDDINGFLAGDDVIDSFFTSPLHFYLYFFSLRNPLLPADIFTTMQPTIVSGSIPTTTSESVNANMVQTMADTSALYKLRQDLLRAGVRRDKQMQVMFGTSVQNPLLHEVQILDSDKSSLNIQSLINQAETDVAPLGARAARGNGSSSLNFQFDSKDFGFLFIVTSFTCRAYYENFMLDKSHTLHPTAWFNPRFNHLGLESVGEHNVSLYYGLREGDFGFAGSDAVAGFSARDWHLKQQVDRVHGLFTNYPFNISQSLVRNSLDELQSYNLTRGDAMFGGFVPTVIDQQVDLFRFMDNLYFNPFMLNNIFVQMSDGLFHGDMSYDHFRCIFRFNVHKVSPMPKLGLLRLD